MIQRFYFDTSVFGGVFDKEFDEATLQLFERVKTGNLICVYSDLTESELVDAPENVRENFKSLPKEKLERTLLMMKFFHLQQNTFRKKLKDQQALMTAYILQLLQ